MSSIFGITISSSSPEIVACQVFLPRGPTAFQSGWMVTRFIPGILKTNKIVVSAAINPPNIQVSATLDTIRDKPRIAVLIGRVDPSDRKVVEISREQEGDELTIYWNDWKIGDIEWSGKKLGQLKK